MSVHARTVAIFGPGLMGGSLLMALRQRHPGVRLAAWARRDGALEELRQRGLADTCSTDAAEVARDADAIVLCVPVDRTAELASRISAVVAPDALVTDVGSVKQPVVEGLEGIFSEHRNFVGSHPMCGSEEAGLAAARADLYEGALCVVTPTANSQPAMVERAAKLWESAGGRAVEMDPAMHDRAAAIVSHVPHVAAAALVELAGRSDPSFRTLCAGGFRDTTRVASGSPELWTAILSQNRAEASRAIAALVGILAEFQTSLENNDTDRILELLSAAAARRAEVFPPI
ncbi:MAG: prephenate dehydrogenase/arogenate dehydrogenase family protein [Chthoniobacterales bacterium]|nr:prephenate dehydrogenase/arogenate dehydrogenase family protein [Chthoniobacterales bacterium]